MATVAGTIYLDGCNYQLQYDILSQSRENNSTTVRLYGVLNVTNNYVSWDNSIKVWVHYTESSDFSTYYARGTHTLIQGDWTFYHNSSGNLTQSIGFGINTSFVSGAGEASITFPHIDRFATITATSSKINDEQNPYVTFANPGNATNLKVWLELPPSLTHYAERNLTISSGTYTLQLTTAERSQIRGQLTTVNSTTIRIVLYSKQGQNQYTSYKDIPYSIINANPTFSNFQFEDTNSTVVALTGSTTNNVINVNGYSNIKATISTTNKATANKQATMSKYRFVIGNTSKDITYSSSASVNNTINGASNGTYNVYAIDSRNNSTLVTKQATRVINYTKVTIDKQNSSFVRDDNQVGENATLTLSGTFWNGNFGQTTNSIVSVTYKLKKSDSSTWIPGTTTITPTTSGGTFTFTGLIASNNPNTKWDLDSSYNLQITVSDKLSTTTAEFILNSAIPTMSLDKNGVGIMCAYDNTLGGYLQVKGEKVRLLGDSSIITASITSNYTIGVSSTYETLPLNTSLKAGSKLSLSSNAIVIGSGVSKVKVSAKVSFNSVATSGVKWLTIYNGNSAVIANPMTLSARNMLFSTDTIIEVQENDKIYLKVSGIAGDIIRSTSTYTNITVEVVE